MPKLCLNMIVKNESKIITRLFDSVCNIIDYYVICDTGSTDNTTTIINEYFSKKNIPGIIITEPFRDFGYNRTQALLACEKTHCEYVLLMDADMILEQGSLFNKQSFLDSLNKGDAHYLFQGSPYSSYKNVRIVKNKCGMTYWGVTHEYICTPPNTVYNTIDRNVLFINDVGDGGAKNDKYERDIRLLLKGLETNPNNDRYTFYLANSYRGNNHLQEAIEAYKKRIKIGGWIEEVWQSYYQMGQCYYRLGQTANALEAWWDAYAVYPQRLENIYEIVCHYKNTGKQGLACKFYKMIEPQLALMRGKQLDFLFTENNIYDYKLDFEYSICAYYVENKDNVEIQKLLMNILNKPAEEYVLTNALNNYKFYASTLNLYDDLCTKRFTRLVELAKEQHNLEGFVSSTPSLCFCKDTIATVIRYVNYTIDGAGNYINKEHIQTHNILAFFDEDKTRLLDYDKTYDCIYVGLEDIRLYNNNNKDAIYFTGNRGINDGTMEVQTGNIDINNAYINAQFIKIPNQKRIEKNWVFHDFTHIIYSWSPLTILQKNTVKTIKDVPHFFQYLRGSTHGIQMPNDETWYICHTVSYMERRKYYHICVVLDTKTCAVKRWTRFFKIEHRDNYIEYLLGFLYLPEENTFLIGYSVNDACTRYRKIKMSDLMALF